MLRAFAVSSALVYNSAFSYVFRNPACHTTIHFGTSHFSATTRHLHVNSISLPLCFWHLRTLWMEARYRSGGLLKRNIRIMCWALLPSLTLYFLQIHLGSFEHQSQLRTLKTYDSGPVLKSTCNILKHILEGWGEAAELLYMMQRTAILLDQMN